YVANHQSSLDLTTFARVYPRKTVLIGKKELAYIPFIGQLYALFGNIFIDRKSTGSGVMGIDQAVNALTVRGDSIFMFPEGTRNLAGRGLLPFKKGAFYMAIEAQVPIIPVVCSSLNPLINFKKRYARSGRLMIRVLPPIHTRGKSMRHLMEIVDETRPLVILLENVPDIMNFGGHNVPEEIAEGLKLRGYVTRYTLLNAAFYGVPQLRERLFLIAFDVRLGVIPQFPLPTHTMELPRGYEGSRAVALKHVKTEGSHFAPIPFHAAELPRSISTEDALSDLPFISDHLRDMAVIRRRKVSDRLPYRDGTTPSNYGRLMRNWYGFSTAGDVTGNVVRLTARDFPIFGRMPRGADYPVALRIAREILEEKIQQEHVPPKAGTAQYKALEQATVPPYDVGKFPNKWWKLDSDAPSRTLTAHLGKDTYSHIHYDGRQKRMISVREAARLQSFPDGFEFAGAINASFRQIGNAVPPLLALAVGKALMTTLKQAIAGAVIGARTAA
ncbi:1-acylglycerol-3-phosphate O-acyltransferase, partial [Accumulibacter sp.]|uniref:1-acylglycerol-3-phosphate O-acyltransferase n=1 Tax=Accumulibacter sp. TaxID=2053492 RepID=UPI001ACFE067